MTTAIVTRRARRRALSGDLSPSDDWRLEAAVALIVVGSVLAIGSVHIASLCVVAAAASLALLALGSRKLALMPASILACALGVYCFCVSLPIPLDLLQRVAPANADVWQRILLMHAPLPSNASLSVDPLASRVEGLKWLTYAVAFELSARLGRKRPTAPARIIFVSASLLAAITMLHGLAGARQVYGFFEATFEPSRWATSPLLNANNLAGYLNLGVFAGVGLLASSRTERFRWAIALGTALALGESMLCGSRGGALSLVLGLCALALWIPRLGRSATSRSSSRRRLWPVLAAVAGGLLFAVVGAKPDNWHDLQEESLEKLDLAVQSLELIRAYPLWGTGPGGFETAFPAFRKTIGFVTWAYPENFVLNALADFGLPLGLAALLGFAWIFRPTSVDAHKSRLAASLYIGVLALCVQNLVDIGFTVPGEFLAVVVALGGLWGAKRQNEAPPSAARFPWSVALGPAALLAVALVASTATRTVYADRVALSQLYASTDFKHAAQARRFEAALDDAVLARPAEPYFYFLGAGAAAHTDSGRALLWAGRALERDALNGRTHLLIASILAHERRVPQAILHLRLAVESEPLWQAEAAALALAWARNATELERCVPAGQAGAGMLYELAVRVAPESVAPSRRLLLEQALQRAPNMVGVHAALGGDLVRELTIEGSPCHASATACRARIENHARALSRLQPKSDAAPLLRGNALAAAGQSAEAVRYLGEHCNRADVPCLERRVQLAAAANLGLEEPVAAFLARGCDAPDVCARSENWVGDIYASKKMWAAALKHFAAAAEQQETQAAWSKVADAAHELGSPRRALEALTRAQRLGPDVDGSIQKRIECERAQLVDELVGPRR